MTRVRWKTAVAAAGAAVCVAGTAPPLSGQQQRPVFRASAELVEVDVVVRDANGNPVRGLTADDFLVFDRSQLQDIETFQAIEPEPDPDGLPPMPMEIHIDIETNTSPRADRLVVLVLDDLHVYRGRNDTVREIARDVVDKLGPDSSMALIHTSGDNNVEVTQNRARLLAAISKFEGQRPVRRPIQACDPNLINTADPEAPATGTDCDTQDFFANQRLYESLENAAHLLGGSDRRRKAFVLVSENIAKDLSGIFQTSIARDTTTPDGLAYAGGGGADAMATMFAGSPTAYMDNALLDMMEAMRRGNVSTYSIDPRGEIGPEDLALECFGAGTGFGDDPCLGGTGGPTDWTGWVRQAQHGLEILSDASGGFAVVNTDDFTEGVEDIMTDLDNYYLLGFYTADHESKGYRRLEVQVKDRPELTLRYRRGYQLDGEEPEDDDVSELASLAGGALPTNDIPMRLFAAAMPYSGREARVGVAMEITVPRFALQSENQRLLDDIEYGMFVIDMDGQKLREQVGRGASIVLRPLVAEDQLPDEVTYEITSVLQLPPGEYQFRASATSERLDLGGSVYMPFTVPDYDELAMGLTDLVLGYADGPRIPVASSEGRSRIPAANLLPFEPTIDRVFSARDTLRLFFQVVQKDPQPATATIQVLSADGGLLLGMELPVEDDERFRIDQELPLGYLAPGLYRLRVAAEGAGFAEKTLGFVVR